MLSKIQVTNKLLKLLINHRLNFNQQAVDYSFNLQMCGSPGNPRLIKNLTNMIKTF